MNITKSLAAFIGAAIITALCAAAPAYVPPWQGPAAAQYTTNWLQRLNRLALDVSDTTGNDGFDSYAGDINTVLEDGSIAIAKLDTAGAGFVYTSRAIVAGDGLTGGGTLASDPTLNVRVGRGLSISSDFIVVEAAIVAGGMTAATVSNLFLLRSGGNVIYGDIQRDLGTDGGQFRIHATATPTTSPANATNMIEAFSGDSPTAEAGYGVVRLYPHGDNGGWVDVSGTQIKNAAAPTEDTDVSTKGYVDSATGGIVTAYVKLSGDTMSGNLLFSEAAARIGGTSGTTPTTKVGTDVEIAGGDGGWNGHAGTVSIHAGVKPHAVGGMPWTTGTVTIVNLPTPTIPDQAVPKIYTDAIKATAEAAVARAGDTMTGPLVTITPMTISCESSAGPAWARFYSDGDYKAYIGILDESSTPGVYSDAGTTLSPLQTGYPIQSTHVATLAYVTNRVSGITCIRTNVVASYMQVSGSSLILSNRLEITGWANGVCTSTIPRFSDVKVGEFAAP